MASTNSLTLLSQPAWAHDKPSQRLPYSIYAHLKTVCKTGGRTPDHVPLRRRCDVIRKNSTKRWSNKEIMAIARRHYCYQLVMGKPSNSNRDKVRHDSFNRCFESTPIWLCVMIVTNMYMFTLLDYCTDGCICPVCPGGHKFTTSHFTCIQQLIRRILVGPKLPPIGPDLLQQLLERHNLYGIWTPHEHFGSFLQYVEQPPYPHPSLTHQQMFPIPRLITVEVLLPNFGPNQVTAWIGSIIDGDTFDPGGQPAHTKCIRGLVRQRCTPTSLLNRIMTDNLVLLGISYSALTHSTALHGVDPIRTTKVGTLLSRSASEYMAHSMVSVFFISTGLN
ncbi:hypothetical protein SARC_01342 [Sphaeroforma arctica JP610]|uniref:Uncharacterized protein n=1 Tax=Sphaeroforma arctica JP610 TaxID=667725 RepID=A0A0L0GBX2_9EUKA|nr:hypothetical protein SARC_01342 [Sphaeroforma arctica JP610]KNC86512.1 hypothetical protein SARC_01342 [Sphaeroforma arctica JP610]|eukprot:XP_014160414.1 hypothetical protein SARC_01342 [Sphaeroforma arctica JP610]